MKDGEELPPDLKLMVSTVELKTPISKTLVTVHPWRQVRIRTSPRR